MDEDWVVAVTRDAMNRIETHGSKVGLANTEEFTFRAFFMAAAADMLKGAKFQTEWHRFDLLVQAGGVNTLVEFKYYLRRRTHDLQGVPGSWKGGPGPKNRAEFYACVAKLREATHPGIGARRLVLVYGDIPQGPEAGAGTRRAPLIAESYGDLGPTAAIARVWPITGQTLHARVLEPTPLPTLV